MFCSEFLSSTNKITVYEHLDKFYLYNTPSMIDNISMILSPFINDHVRSKIEYVLKRDSTIALEQFYNK